MEPAAFNWLEVADTRSSIFPEDRGNQKLPFDIGDP